MRFRIEHLGRGVRVGIRNMGIVAVGRIGSQDLLELLIGCLTLRPCTSTGCVLVGRLSQEGSNLHTSAAPYLIYARGQGKVSSAGTRTAGTAHASAIPPTIWYPFQRLVYSKNLLRIERSVRY